ncbi:hypothetical protein OAV22_02055 [Flavobacteriaceae bacterium]|nr:hypothetical protein [Flavobacteriaceae bacterium]
MKPFLHEARYEEIADATCNPYNHFPCHKTTESDDDGETYCTEKTLQCAGFTQMQCEQNGKDMPDGMTHDQRVFDYYEMIDAHECWDGENDG